MTIQDALNQKNISIYRLAKESDIPYATCNDIVNGKAQLEKCSAETVYRIAQVLDISMEELLSPYIIKRTSFENFKSTICHRVKELGDIDFIIETLEKSTIFSYYKKKWYPETLYLLAMVDYLCRENNIPICEDYDSIRKCKLEKPVYPAGVIALSETQKNNSAKKQAEAASIPEFSRFNIIESEVRNVI